MSQFPRFYGQLALVLGGLVHHALSITIGVVFVGVKDARSLSRIVSQLLYAYGQFALVLGDLIPAMLSITVRVLWS